MSDLCIYEIEDNLWDEFGASDDHIVPHPSNEYLDQYATQGDGRKKSRYEVTGFTSIADNLTIYGIQGKEENDLLFMSKKDKMLEKGSWSDTQDGVFPASRDSDTAKEVTSEASDGARMSSQGSKSGTVSKLGEFSEENHILGDRCVSEDDNVYCYPLNHISQADNDLSFLDSDREDKESSDLLYYGWSDIGNFEDVDRMFRSCDSTFGLGSLSNEQDLCWFSPTNAAEGSEDILKSGSEFNGFPEHQEASGENGAGASTDDSNKKILGAGEKINFKSLDTDDSGLNHLSFVNGLDTQSESADDLMVNEKVNLQKRQLKQQNKSDGKRKDRHVENGSFQHYDELKQFTDLKHLFGDSSLQVFSPSGLQPHKQNTKQNSLNYMETHIPYMRIDYSHPSDQISVCPTPSGTKFENNTHISPSQKESSYASNQVQSMESSHGLPFEAPSVTTNEKREKLFHCQDLQAPFSGNFKHANVAGPVEFCSSLSVQKQVHQSELGMEGNSEVDGVSIKVPAEFDSSNGQESSCMSSVLDEISLEATSFRQLQQVMEKLDIRTKLCIRDSLYRLARSAEQRHNCANSSAGIIVDRDATGALMAEETNKCTGFIDMETDTNPIDRSIAHLLFHRPSDPTVMHAKDAFSFKSQAIVNGSITSPPVKGEKQVCLEDTTNDADKHFLTSDNK
ncbi:protein LNK1 isoform X1 [Pistacia vera]|uniref:protein LNK1 isoform X1 n=2 Tax=Pistacia vera TaxID=55513 RepID=UPI0012632353|nr:protein LNK1 isoform X1 [Pistacia vera]XP_031253201.1 protein LNK1 isoform X1 [Pistacia vera]